MTNVAERGPLWEIFLEELHEYADALGRDAMALERGDGDSSRHELLGSLFRTAHSLKTGAAALGVEVVSASCHALEGILAATLRGEGPSDTDLVRLLLAASDAMGDSVARVQARDDLVWTQMVTLLPQLVQAMPETEAMPPSLVDDSQEIGSDRFPSFRQPGDPTPSPAQAASERGSYRLSGRHSNKGRAPRSVRVSTTRINSLLARGDAVVRASSRLHKHVGELNAILDALQTVHGGKSDGEPATSATSRQLLKLQIRLQSVAEAVDQDQDALADVLALQAALVRLRMVPFDRVSGRVERAVRDLATASNRRVELVIQGGDVEVERAVLERLVDPLFHLVRNAIGHGIESPAERKQAGKPEWGTVTVRAIRLEGAVAIEVEDDGAGVNLGALRRVAAEQGVNGSDDKDVARLVFEAGLSTADQVTPISGRGIGLDVVRARVRELGGQVELVTHADFGTTFRIEVPETPAETATAPDLEDSD